MKRQTSTVIGALGILLVVAATRTSTMAQGLPNWLNYQGRLTSPSGAAVADGTYSVTFHIFDNPTAGAELWQEVKSVATHAGVFSTVLGQSTAFPSGMFAKRLFLQMEIGGRMLTPRQELGSVPFAMTALNLPNGTITSVMIGTAAVTTAKIADGAVTEAKLAPGVAVPIGGVVAWWGDSYSPPVGWKVCDGTSVSDSTSPLNGMAIPDLRNHFIRGATGNVRTSLPTGGRDVINLAHTHTVNAHSHGISNDLDVGTMSAIHHVQHLSGSSLTGDEASNGQVGNFNGGGFLIMFDGDGNRSQVVMRHNHGGRTDEASPGTSAALTEDQSIVPSYTGLIYIMRVK